MDSAFHCLVKVTVEKQFDVIKQRQILMRIDMYSNLVAGFDKELSLDQNIS